MSSSLAMYNAMRSVISATVLLGLLAGCNMMPTQRHAPDETPVITGSPSRRNYTPLEPALACLGHVMQSRKVAVLPIAVGDVKDYSGKYSQNEGNAITQGGALMIYSALGKLGGAIQIQERFDTRIAELELAYTEKRQLGDGRTHNLEAGKPAVPWVPYFGGSILRSQYYIVGGITELNYNIASSGTELGVSGVGVKRRTFTMNIGVDLRMVDTRSLVVVRTVSLQKQVIGEEVGAGVYKFFGNSLVDVNVGSKNQEPLQLGVRTAIEHGVLELVSAAAGVEPGVCMDASGQPVASTATARQGAVVAPTAAKSPTVSAEPPKNAPTDTARPENMGAAGGGAELDVPFELGSAGLSVQATSTLVQVASDALQGRRVTLQLVARDNETLAGNQRRQLTNQRVIAITNFLTAKGVSAQLVGVSWMPEPTDQQITRAGPGFQRLATLVVSPSVPVRPSIPVSPVPL